MKATDTNHPDEPLTTLTVMANPTAVAVVGQPGWLTKRPEQIEWEALGRGVNIFGDEGVVVGTAATDAADELARFDAVHLLAFDGVRFTELFQPVPLHRR